MAAQVIQPQKKGGIAELLPVAGAIAGGVLGAGNPVGIAGGAALGSQLAGVAQPMVAQAESKPSTAIERRMGGAQMMLPPNDQFQAIQDARIALQSQPPELQQQYGPMLTAAAYKLRQNPTGVA